jgi:osmotically-inducible protein OsmY
VVRPPGELSGKYRTGSHKPDKGKETTMKYARAITLAVLTGITLISSGCAVMRGQESVGAYVDDKTITAAVKAKLIEDKNTGGLSINVDTLNGAVALSGFAKSQMEKDQAGAIARNTRGVREVHNNLIVRP